MNCDPFYKRFFHSQIGKKKNVLTITITSNNALRGSNHHSQSSGTMHIFLISNQHTCLNLNVTPRKSSVLLLTTISPSSHDLDHIGFHSCITYHKAFPDSEVHGANMGPTWALSAPDGPHVGPMNLAIRAGMQTYRTIGCFNGAVLSQGPSSLISITYGVILDHCKSSKQHGNWDNYSYSTNFFLIIIINTYTWLVLDCTIVRKTPCKH